MLSIAAPPAIAGMDSDAEVLALVHKHCVMGHAPIPTHQSFHETPKNVVLENHLRTDETRRYRLNATGEDPGDALGNQTDTTEDERARLGQWLKELPRAAR